MVRVVGSGNSDLTPSGNSGHPEGGVSGPDSPWKAAGEGMIDMLKRHAVQVLRKAGHTLEETAKLGGVSVRSVQRIEDEPAVVQLEGEEERRRNVGRPSKAKPFRGFVTDLLREEPELLSVEILRRARLKGYEGAKSALYGLVRLVRPVPVRPLVRFEGLPGEFTQHDFGEVDVRFLDGTRKRVHFCLPAEVLAVGGGVAGRGRTSGELGAVDGVALRVDGRDSPAGRLRSSQDGSPQVEALR